MLGFIKRFGREFDDLYVSLVRPIIEFGCCVWSPYYQVVYMHCIEMIQRRFIRFALSRLPWLDSMNLPPYVDRFKLLDIQPLQLRRINFDCMLIYDLLSGKIDSPSLLENLSFIGVQRTNYANNAPFERAVRNFSDKEPCFDFNLTREIYKSKIVSYHG
jgi:hypothetical protein